MWSVSRALGNASWCIIVYCVRPVCPVMVIGCVQVPLMAALPSARAAMDAHRGVAAVAEYGLCFLSNLASADANMVRWMQGWLCGLFPVHSEMRHCVLCPSHVPCDGTVCATGRCR